MYDIIETKGGKESLKDLIITKRSNKISEF